MSHRRSVEDERRLKKTYEETKNDYGPGVWYDERKGRYIRSNFTDTWLKTHCRRVIRRRLKQDAVFYEKGLYKKYFDYWWEKF